MGRNGKKARRLAVGEETFLWSIGHQHQVVVNDQGAHLYSDCTEIVTLRRRGVAGRILIAFRSGDGRFVSDGILPGGAVGTTGGGWLNLHEPGTVRALLDEAVDQGWNSDANTVERVDGRQFFDAVASRRSGR